MGTVRFAKGGLDSPRRIDPDADDRWQTSSAADMKHGRSVEIIFLHAIPFSLIHDRLALMHLPVAGGGGFWVVLRKPQVYTAFGDAQMVQLRTKAKRL